MLYHICTLCSTFIFKSKFSLETTYTFVKALEVKIITNITAPLEVQKRSWLLSRQYGVHVCSCRAELRIDTEPSVSGQPFSTNKGIKSPISNLTFVTIFPQDNVGM